jgi:DtxR family Mn-dependent transcriptional regulator
VVLLGDPATCPHGNPIPGSANQPAGPVTQVPLSQVAVDDVVRFERLSEDVELDGAALLYLDEAGFIPGATATVTTRAPDGTVLLEVEGNNVALGQDLSRRLFVAVL